MEDRNLQQQTHLLETSVILALGLPKFSLTPDYVLNLQRAAVTFLTPSPGQFRKGGAHIRGSEHEPPHWSDIEQQMQDYFRYINENWADLSPLHLAAYAMWRLTWIHPFEDGNGRTARAVSYFVLCVKYGRWLPGCGTFLQEINEDRASHYAILRVTDLLHQSKGRIELNTLEEHLADVLKVQLRSRL